MSDILRVDEAPKFEEAERLAVRAFFRGTATGPQQKIAANVILTRLAPITAAEPATLSERAAGFLSGRKWVGYQLAALGGIQLFRAEPDGK